MRRTAVFAALGWMLALAPVAHADAISAVRFDVESNASFWGPNRSAGIVNKSGSSAIEIFGKDVGVGYRVVASTGSVAGSYSGNLLLTGAASHDLASGLFSFGSAFTATGMNLGTAYGASVDVFGFVEDVGQLSFPGFPKGNTLGTSSNTKLDVGTQRTFSGSTNFDVTGLDLWLVEFGAVLELTQTNRFKPTGISGSLLARHRETGTVMSRAYTVGSSIGLDLGLAGTWDISLLGMDLDNSFSTSLGGGIGGYVDSVLGRSQLTTNPITFLSADPFELGFNQLRWNNAMSVTVFDSSATGPQPTPEPGTWLLMGGVGLVAVIRRLRRSITRCA